MGSIGSIWTIERIMEMVSGELKQQPIKTAVITGGHPYDVIGFNQLFRSLEGVDAYIQHMDDFCSSSQQARDSYDVALFYHMLMPTPQDEGLPGYAGRPKTVLEGLGKTAQGIVVLHHALLAYPAWPVWSEIVGIQNRRFGYYPDQSLDFRVANAGHPITQSLQGWSLVDESYTMDSASAGSTILLTTDHPNSMKTIAWTREYQASRVLCYESGHDQSTYGNPDFRRFLARGIAWSARRI